VLDPQRRKLVVPKPASDLQQHTVSAWGSCDEWRDNFCQFIAWWHAGFWHPDSFWCSELAGSAGGEHGSLRALEAAWWCEERIFQAVRGLSSLVAHDVMEGCLGEAGWVAGLLMLANFCRSVVAAWGREIRVVFCGLKWPWGLPSGPIPQPSGMLCVSKYYWEVNQTQTGRVCAYFLLQIIRGERKDNCTLRLCWDGWSGSPPASGRRWLQVSPSFPSIAGWIAFCSVSSERKCRDQSCHTRTAQVQGSGGKPAHSVDTPVEKSAEFAKKGHAVIVGSLVTVNKTMAIVGRRLRMVLWARRENTFLWWTLRLADETGKPHTGMLKHLEEELVTPKL